MYPWNSHDEKQAVSYWFAGDIGEFDVKVQFGFSWNSRSENNLQFDALKRSNFSLSHL